MKIDIKEMIKKEIEKVEKEVSENRNDFNLGKMYELLKLETMIETAEEIK